MGSAAGVRVVILVRLLLGARHAPGLLLRTRVSPDAGGRRAGGILHAH